MIGYSAAAAVVAVAATVAALVAAVLRCYLYRRAKDFPPNWGYDWRTGLGFRNLLRVANLAPTGKLSTSSNFG